MQQRLDHAATELIGRVEPEQLRHEALRGRAFATAQMARVASSSPLRAARSASSSSPKPLCSL